MTSSARITSILTGPWAEVASCNGNTNYNACLSAALSHSLDPLVACAPVVGSAANPVFNAVRSEYGTAQVNAYSITTRTHDWFKDLNCAFRGIDKPVPVITNLGISPSFPGTKAIALYNFFPEYILLSAKTTALPNGCHDRNAALNTTQSHEYMHFIIDQLLELELNPAVTQLEHPFHEGMSDLCAALLWDTPAIGAGIDSPQCAGSGVSGFRSHIDDPNINTRFDAIFPDPTNFPSWCSSPPHCKGLAISGAFWDLRKTIGDAATERLFGDFMFLTHGRMDGRIIVEVLTADDLDGNICMESAGEHQLAILDAFGLHGWTDPCPLPTEDTVDVQWTGPGGVPCRQGDAACPSNGDYVVILRAA